MLPNDEKVWLNLDHLIKRMVMDQQKNRNPSGAPGYGGKWSCPNNRIMADRPNDVNLMENSKMMGAGYQLTFYRFIFPIFHIRMINESSRMYIVLSYDWLRLDESECQFF